MRLTILLSLIINVSVQGQRPWEKFDNMDSVTFVETFGTITQYNYQKSIEQKSSHKMLCIWTGSKPQWLYNFAMYLSVKDYNVIWDDDSDTEIVIEATPKIYTTTKAPVIKLRAPYNENIVTTSATITGPADDIIKIYIDYWELTGLSFNDLKTKKAITKDFVSDKVSFTWTGANPVITVTKNPNAPIDLFPLK